MPERRPPAPGRSTTPRAEDGFTLIELLVAIFVLTVGVMSVVGSLDGARGLVTLSERKEAAVHVGEREIEEIESLAYAGVALTAAPGTSADPNDPRFHVSATGSPPTYRWSQRPGAAEAPEPLVVDAAAGTLAPGPEAWTDGRISGQVHRFVTSVDDPTVAGTDDYRRVTVAVTVDGSAGPTQPILLATLKTDPGDGSDNPANSPSTTCKNAAGATVECTSNIGAGRATTWFLSDTPASSDARAEIVADHETHPTVAPTGSCTTAAPTGCPIPDLLTEQPPPDLVPQQPLFRYSSEEALAGPAGGRVLTRDVACDQAPSSTDNQRGALWTTAPLTAGTSLTGRGGLSLYTQTLSGASAPARLCLAFYDVPGDIGSPVASPPTEIGRTSFALGSWPASPAPVSFTFDFRGAAGAATVPLNHRVGVRMWAAPGPDSGADLALLYDHPLYPSSLQLNAGS